MGIIDGTSGNDDLLGTGDADVINGLAGDDTLQGGDGDDILQGGSGADSMDGGAGFDVVSFASASSGIRAFLDAGNGGGIGFDAIGDAWTGSRA